MCGWPPAGKGLLRAWRSNLIRIEPCRQEIARAPDGARNDRARQEALRRQATRTSTASRRRQRQVDGEDGALAELAVDIERAPVVAHDMLDDGEAEPGAAELARAGGIDTVEALGEPRQVLARDALAMVAHGDG